MNGSWMKVQDRKRNLAAAASTASLYALAFVAALLIGSLSPASLASVPGTVIVDLGGTEGAPGETPLGLENAPERPAESTLGAAPLPASAAGSPEMTAPIAAPSAVPLEAPSTTRAVAEPPALKSAPPATAVPKAAAPRSTAARTAAPATPAVSSAAVSSARTAQEEAALRAAAASATAPAGPPKTRTFGSSSSTGSGAPVASSGAGSQPGVEGGTGSVTFRGSEMGSALVTTFGASSGQVGRNIYVPVYLYMPLPAKVDAAIYQNIQAKETFRSYYQQSGSDWVLQSQVPLAQRGDFWTMLEAAGYDASTADFKTQRKLSPVVLEFTVGPLARNKVELVDVRLASSSGSSEIDEAVIYGFRQASFFNKTGNAVSGKFVYSF